MHLRALLYTCVWYYLFWSAWAVFGLWSVIFLGKQKKLQILVTQLLRCCWICLLFHEVKKVIVVITPPCMIYLLKVVQHLGPATDFYKKLALDCSGQQTAVDLFLLSSQYSDLASLGKEYLVPTFCSVVSLQKHRLPQEFLSHVNILALM